MNNLNLYYPAMPIEASKDVIKPSRAFKRRVLNAAAAILLFVVSYIFIFFIAICVAILLGAIGVWLVMLKAMFYTGIICLGLVFSGLMLIYFVIKFLFKKSVTDLSEMIEVNRQNQETLFKFIDQITIETGAPRPKKIYLSADVNAGVFYESDFWSMFLPVRKNLKIGLGLVNSVNLSEFKAIMAHEFGHFSQRSMKFGSYVYNMNKVVYNMLYDNQSYDNLAQRIVKLNSYLSIGVWINLKVVKGMQYLLRKVYIVLNKAHLALSREMEFHADAMSAYIGGSDQAISALKRIKIGQTCYDELLEYWDGQIALNNQSENLYPQHKEVMVLYAKKRKILVDKCGLPVPPLNRTMPEVSEISINDQWATHPSMDDREKYLKKIGIQGNKHSDSAWAIFENAEQLQQSVTRHLYRFVENKPDTKFLGKTAFTENYVALATARDLPATYNGFYDARNINYFDVQEAAERGAITHLNIENILSETNCEMPKVYDRMATDANWLDSLFQNPGDINTFDFRGEKYPVSQALEVATFLRKERELVEQQIVELDRDVFCYYYNKRQEAEARQQLIEAYNALFLYQDQAVKHYDIFNDVVSELAPVYQTMSFSDIENAMEMIYEKESLLKPLMTTAFADPGTLKHLTAEQQEQIREYIDNPKVYYANNNYNNEALNAFRSAAYDCVAAVSDRCFELKRIALEKQLEV